MNDELPQKGPQKADSLDAIFRPRYMVLKYPHGGGAQIPPDEPVFVIRAQDGLALEMVRFYAYTYQVEYGQMADEKVVDELQAHYKAIEDWQKANPEKVKMADLP